MFLNFILPYVIFSKKISIWISTLFKILNIIFALAYLLHFSLENPITKLKERAEKKAKKLTRHREA